MNDGLMIGYNLTDSGGSIISIMSMMIGAMILLEVGVLSGERQRCCKHGRGVVVVLHKIDHVGRGGGRVKGGLQLMRGDGRVVVRRNHNNPRVTAVAVAADDAVQVHVNPRKDVTVTLFFEPWGNTWRCEMAQDVGLVVLGIVLHPVRWNLGRGWERG